MKRSVIILLIASSLQADDNHVHIDQSGANMQMEIDQIAGTINKILPHIDLKLYRHLVLVDDHY